MQNSVTHIRSAMIAPYAVVRIALGLLLLTAAGLKGYELATEPVAETGLLTSRWFLIGVVEFELFFGLWLLAGLHPRLTWATALLCFGGFAAVSLYKALSGEATCGCFGKVPVNPWYTFLLDTAAVAALSWWRPPLGSSQSVQRNGRLLFRPAEVAILCLALGVPAGLAMGSYRAATLDDTGEIFGDSRFVVLKPETWVGKRFPLIRYIDVGAEFMQGEWLVVLYHHDCPKCKATLSRYRQLAWGHANQTIWTNIALVELPPYGDTPTSSIELGSPCVVGRLQDVADWLVATPVEVILRNGRVVEVL